MSKKLVLLTNFCIFKFHLKKLIYNQNLFIMEGQQPQPQLPNATATLVLGILSIVFGCLFVGLVLGIIGLVLSKKGKEAYQANPSGYSGYGSLNAGRILSIIGIVLNGLWILYLIIFVAIIGVASIPFWSGLS